MARSRRAAAHSVSFFEALEQEPFRFDLFHVLRRLDAQDRERPRLGRSPRLADDRIRLGQEASLAFEAAAIASFRPGSNGAPHRLFVFAPGLLGPHGPLPLHVTEFIRTRARTYGDRAALRFLDVFHHRMLSLFYRAWSAAQPTVHLDRPAEDRFALWVGATIGHGAPSFVDRDRIPRHAKLYLAGRFAPQTRCAEGLEAALTEFFEVPAQVHSFLGTWLDVPEEARWHLGADGDRGRLGRSATLGARVWDRHQAFLIELGPLYLADYERFLPGGESLRRLVDLVRNYIGDELDWSVRLRLRRDDVPSFRLGGPTRLGRTTWIFTRPPESDPADVVLRPHA
jgi:type VI secretion system protein ImpH